MKSPPIHRLSRRLAGGFGPCLHSGLIVAMLSVSAGDLAAAELYRWSEPDGSITFSPQPPPAGTAYELVGTAEAADAEPATLAPKAGSLSADDRSRAASAEAAEPVTPAVAGSEPSLRGSPDRLAPPLGAAISAPRRPAAPRVTNETERSAWASPDSSRRDERCRELEKRVVSLERRLMTRLTAEDMDNTVLYMARYQQSVEQHCRG